MRKRVGVGIIGGGLMGKEAASASGRWLALEDSTVEPYLVSVADLNTDVLDWFDTHARIPHLTTDYKALLEIKEIEVVYVAVPHDLHEQIYIDVLRAGKDLLAEKPFGIDLAASQHICEVIKETGRFVRCSSEFPFFPGAQKLNQLFAGKLEVCGDLLEVNCAFLHSSDLNRDKPINWKRQVSTCGKAGVMNDLGLHVAHMPLRLGLKPFSVFAQLQNVVTSRKNGAGQEVPCDTWDNATLHCTLENGVPLRLETKRLAPGHNNTWSVEVLGTDLGASFTTKNPKSFKIIESATGTARTSDLEHRSIFKTITGPIFEFGFPDALLQMWAAFFAEREGVLGDRFGCATPEEALFSHRIWDAALRSHESGRAETI